MSPFPLSTSYCYFRQKKYNVSLVVYVVLQFFAFLFVLVGTPSDMFRERFRGGDPLCITLWGLRVTCSSSDYLLFIEMYWSDCRGRVARFRAAQGCAIISVFVFAAALIAGLTLLFCCSSLRLVCLALNIVGSVTVFVVWVAMATTFHHNDGSRCPPMKVDSVYGSGFVLFLIAWLLDIINIILLLPYTPMDADPNERAG
ncbi:Amastin surface glycoprotein, putative [Leishmania donovani]|uniref:Amastin surface glycoprotein, putative n=1 Tax=Leishmania donovani TaxID=5661 RepID=A0A3S5H7W6_LEIDO|nr:Amastin surface glycoprotein, putative [Leishmania donovani]AYU82512.1 Amastin surface glycoprotein, putative [Leishmania donovani]